MADGVHKVKPTSPHIAWEQTLGMLRGLVRSYAGDEAVRSIAVVGNAPLAPSDERAQAVDAADLVLRVNSFVLDEPGQPRTQGRRVDVVLFNRLTRVTPWFFHAYTQRLYLLVEPMRMHGNPEMWPSSWPPDLGLVPVSNRDFTAPLCDLLGIPWHEERLAPTTGTMAAFVALTLFPAADVVLTGFSIVDDPQQTSWAHQFGDSSPVGKEHRIAHEAALISSWLAQGRARLLR